MPDKEDIFLWITKLPFIKGLFFLQTILYIVSLPLLVIYFQFNKLFIESDLFKLILLSSSIGGILYCLFFLIAFASYVIKDAIILDFKTTGQKSWLLTNGLISLLVFEQLLKFVWFKQSLDYMEILKGLSSIIVILFLIGLYQTKRLFKKNG